MEGGEPGELLRAESAERIDAVRGDETALAFPTHPDALRAMGVDFLTEAFRAYGWLGPDNRVARITRCEICAQGSTGQKLLLSVEYGRPQALLHNDLFVKFSRDFDDPVRDARGKYEMASEVRLGALSRHPAFPVKVPDVYFADYHQESHSGLLITSLIPFGQGGIEPHLPKCMDHHLASPVVYYRAILRAVARLAAAHRSGRLSPEVERRFPHDPVTAAKALAIPYSGVQLVEHIAQCADFAARNPHVLPAHLRDPSLFASLARAAPGFLAGESLIRQFLQSDADLIALCHWNANIDNAWFWRDECRKLHCGLMDWGHVGQMNVAFAIWGALSGAGIDVWDRHSDRLIALFIEELAQGGGPRLAHEVVELHLFSYIALMGLGYFVESPARLLRRMPGIGWASGPRDPLIEGDATLRNQLHMMTVFLHVWATRDFESLPARIAARA